MVKKGCHESNATWAFPSSILKQDNGSSDHIPFPMR